MPPKTLSRLGVTLLFLALALYFSAGQWLNSRIFVPLDYRVTLDARHLQSPPFQVNLNETYFASLELDYSADDWNQDNLCNYKTILDPQWRIYRLVSTAGEPRKLWVTSAEDTRQIYYWSGFRLPRGKYQLEWDTPVAASCLNGRHPRLLVSTNSWGYRQAIDVAQLISIFMGGTGLALIVLATLRAARHALPLAVAPRMFPDMALRNFIPLTKHTPLLPIHALPHWGIFGGAILWVLIIIFMMFGPQTPHGLLVSLSSRKVTSLAGPAQETLGVYVDPKGRFFVNGEEVERKGLHTKLLDHLSRSTSWTVYFEADSDSLYMDTVYAIDTIQGCGAKFIWITPKMREEWKHREPAPHNIP